MQVQILIVDGVAAKRVALRVKLCSAWYDVKTAASGAEGLALIGKSPPALVLVGDTLPDMTAAQFCAALGSRGAARAVPVLAISDGPTARAELLAAGAEDVLSADLSDGLLVARIRAVLRSHQAEAEWRLREGTCRALGFAEPAASFAARMGVQILAADPAQALGLQAALQDHDGLRVSLGPAQPLSAPRTKAAQDDIILLPLSNDAQDTGLGLLADIRVHPDTHSMATLVICPHTRADLAARALDMGADDVVLAPALSEHGALPADVIADLTLRAARLHQRNRRRQSLRKAAQRGAEAAMRDPLTGLYNRRYALPHLDRVADEARISGRPFAVMIADLDHFKHVNDRFGHAAGDAVLRACAARLKQGLRASDMIARYGGEEFIIVLPGTGPDAARRAATRLCRHVSSKPIRIPGTSHMAEVTVSIGLAVSSAQGDLFDAADMRATSEPAALLARADQALYLAKSQGRNRYMLEQASRPAA